MMHRVPGRLLLAGLAVCALASVAFSLPLGEGEQNADAAQLSEADAVALAITYAQTPLPYFHMTSEPTRINGAVMTIGDAQELKDGYRQPPSTHQGRDPERLVWLFFLRGDVTVVNQAAPPRPGMPAIPAKPPDIYRQMSVMLDATTGEQMEIGTRPPDRENAAADNLPILPVPTEKRSIEVLRIVRPAGTAELMRGPAPPAPPSHGLPSGPGAPPAPPRTASPDASSGPGAPQVPPRP